MFPSVYAGLTCVAKKRVQHSLSQPLTRLLESSPVTAASEISEDNQYDVLDRALTPLSKMPYIDQLEHKQSWISSVLTDYSQSLEHQCRRLSKTSPLIKPHIHRICPCPVTEGYRNAHRFPIGTGIDGNPKTVGFLLGRPRYGKTVCVLSKDSCAMRLSHYKVAKAFEDFIRSSPLRASFSFDDLGFWREVRVRSNEIGHVMATIIVNPRNATQMMIQDQQELLRQYFVEGPGAECQVHSLYFQACPHSFCSNDQAKFIHLHGEKYLEEKLNGRMFRITPGAFFQTNTKMAETLYEKILSVANLSKQTTLLDLCCGSGAISILASPFVRGTVGIDECKDSIDDAIHNAVQNQIHNAYFTAGRVERLLKKLLEELGPSPDIVAVINPRSDGVQNNVIRLLRNIPQLRKVIYVACKLDHKAVKKNIITLIQPDEGIRFKISKVIPVDMFPNSPECEVILSLDPC